MAEISECLNLSFEQDSGAKTPLSDIENVDKELEQDARAKDSTLRQPQRDIFFSSSVQMTSFWLF